MVKEGIILAYNISKRGIEVDKANIEEIEKLPPLVLVKGIQSFLGHTGFYSCFIMEFSKITNTLCNILDKKVKFIFNDACFKAFE